MHSWAGAAVHGDIAADVITCFHMCSVFTAAFVTMLLSRDVV